MTHFHYVLIAFAEWTFWAVTLLLAFWRGDRLAQRIALILLVGQLAATIPMRLFDLPRWWYGLTDTVCLALMIPVALREARPWVLWACGFQLAMVASAAAYLLDREIHALALATAANTWTLLTVSALLWGTVQAWRRRAPRAATGEAAS